MSATQLHEFDLGLCDYACGTVGGHMRYDDVPDCRQLRDWLGGAVDPRLFKYIRSPREPRLLLGEDELHRLASVMFCPMPQLYRPWVPWGGLHDRYVYCLAEIRDGLSKATADEFAEVSRGFAGRLTSERLDLHDGLRVVEDWIDHLRRLKRALGRLDLLPWPDGTFPSPAHQQVPDTVGASASPPAGTNPVVGRPAGAAPGRKGRPVAEPSVGPDGDEVLSPAAAARLLGTSAKHVIRLVDAGSIPAVNVGRGALKPRYRIRPAALDNFLNGRRSSPAEPARPTRRTAKPRVVEHLVDHFA